MVTMVEWPKSKLPSESKDLIGKPSRLGSSFVTPFGAHMQRIAHAMTTPYVLPPAQINIATISCFYLLSDYLVIVFNYGSLITRKPYSNRTQKDRTGERKRERERKKGR